VTQRLAVISGCRMLISCALNSVLSSPASYEDRIINIIHLDDVVTGAHTLLASQVLPWRVHVLLRALDLRIAMCLAPGCVPCLSAVTGRPCSTNINIQGNPDRQVGDSTSRLGGSCQRQAFLLLACGTGGQRHCQASPCASAMSWQAIAGSLYAALATADFSRGPVKLVQGESLMHDLLSDVAPPTGWAVSELHSIGWPAVHGQIT